MGTNRKVSVPASKLLDEDWCAEQERNEIRLAERIQNDRRRNSYAAAIRRTEPVIKNVGRRAKNGRVRTIAGKSHAAYLAGKQWLAIRIQHFRRFGATCVVCGGTERINVHHLVYRGRGKEKPNDLVSVCREHHEQFHREFGAGRRDFTEPFKKFCARERPRYGFED